MNLSRRIGRAMAAALLLGLGILAAPASASKLDEQTTDPRRIQAILGGIRAGSSESLLSVVERAGLRVRSIVVSVFDSADAKHDTFYKPGDRYVDLFFGVGNSGPCSGKTANFVVRNSAAYPDDIGANWLFTGDCRAPR